MIFCEVSVLHQQCHFVEAPTIASSELPCRLFVIKSALQPTSVVTGDLTELNLFC